MKNNQLIVESQETGKTTYLFKEINRLISDGLGVILLDSATEHEDKSLLRKVIKQHSNSVVIDMRDEKQVVLGRMTIGDFIQNYMNYFPFNEVVKNRRKIICFDLSFFLERGHEGYEKTGNIEQYHYYRKLYNDLAQQIVLALILMEKCSIISDIVVVMDEIEFPVTDYDFSCLQDDLHFLAAVHPENAFGTFYQSFSKLKFMKYLKIKE